MRIQFKGADFHIIASISTYIKQQLVLKKNCPSFYQTVQDTFFNKKSRSNLYKQQYQTGPSIADGYLPNGTFVGKGWFAALIYLNLFQESILCLITYFEAIMKKIVDNFEKTAQ